MIQLRPYQDELFQFAREAFRNGSKRILIQSPTGSGKTALTACMIKSSADKGKRCWFTVHRQELLDQSIRTFQNVGVEFGVIASGRPTDYSKRVQIASIETLRRRVDKLQSPDLIVIDECHHATSKTWSAMLDSFPDAYRVGLTATPERLDGRGLGEHFETMIRGPEVSWLIENGFLSRYKYYAPSIPDLSDCHTLAGDYKRDEIDKIIGTPQIIGNAVDHYQRLCNGKRFVVFCPSIKTSLTTQEAFRNKGYTIEHIDGDTNKDHRKRLVEQFSDGKINGLTNVDLFGEGFDLPAIEAVILLRPTQSLSLYLQQVGRSLRPFEGKDHAYILDHAGNVFRHGMPDEHREWNLESKRRTKQDNQEKPELVSMCKNCFASLPPGLIVCTECGSAIERKRKSLKEVAGELKELKAEALKERRKQERIEQGQCRTLNDLIARAKRKGYSNPYFWANKILQARKNKCRI